MANRIVAAAVFVLVFLGTVGVRTFASRPLSDAPPGAATTGASPLASSFQRDPANAAATAATVAGAERLHRIEVAPATNVADADERAADEPRESSVEVPVMVTVEESPDTGRQNAVIRNRSPHPLDVTVVATNPASGSRSVVQVSIPPRSPINLSDVGLVVTKGAQLSVESPPYLSQTTTVY